VTLMANQPFDELERTQRETVQALRLLTGQLRRSRSADDVPVAPAFAGLGQPPQPSPEQPSSGERASRQTGASGLDGIAPPASTSRPDEFLLLGHAGVQNALGQTTRAVESLTQSVTRNTDVLNDTSKSIVDGIRSVFGSLAGLQPRGSGGSSFLGGGLGLASLGLKIAGLFRGEKEEAVQPTRFDLPSGIDLEAANASNVLTGFPRVVRGQSEQVRIVQPQPASAQIVVNVSAMDSQSFMDRSSDIAQAVRDAMLHMHPLNDIVNEV